VDDSGDAGFKLDSGSSRFLVMAACIFVGADAMDQAAAAVENCRVELGLGARFEFKYGKTAKPFRDAFFTAVERCPFSVRAIVFDKATMNRATTPEMPHGLGNYAITQLLLRRPGSIVDAKLVIDGKDSKAFGITKATYFRKTINGQAPGTVRKVYHADSARDRLVQLADMVAGAIHRFERTGGTEAQAHMAVVRKKAVPPLGDLWHYLA
jgi:hypothetical protein